MARSPFSLPAVRAATPRRMALPRVRVLMLAAVLGLVGVLGGSLLGTTLQQRSGLLPAATGRGNDQQVVTATIARLESEQATLKRQIGDAQHRLDQLQSGSAQEKAQLSDITTALAAERVTAGLVPLAGPGVVATFQDSTDTTIPPNEDPAHYLLHDYDLRDVVNTLWASGAEAISINGERILATTSLYCVGTTIICNVTRLSPPYEVHAIGNPDTLAAGLTSAPQMQDLHARAQVYDLPIDIRKDTHVTVPAYSGAFAFKYALPSAGAGAPAGKP